MVLILPAILVPHCIIMTTHISNASTPSQVAKLFTSSLLPAMVKDVAWPSLHWVANIAELMVFATILWAAKLGEWKLTPKTF